MPDLTGYNRGAQQLSATAIFARTYSIAMKLHLHSVFIGLFLFTFSAASGEERFPWLTDLDQARELAAATDKPLLIVFRCEP